MHRYKEEASSLIKLATPVLIASVAQTGMGFVDTVMAGGVSATDMAAVSVASSIWLPSILFGIGLLMALVPVVAQLNGSARRERSHLKFSKVLSCVVNQYPDHWCVTANTVHSTIDGRRSCDGR